MCSRRTSLACLNLESMSIRLSSSSRKS
jgi:hypothetical protein